MTGSLLKVRERLKLLVSLSALFAGLLGLAGYLKAEEPFLNALYNTVRLFFLDYAPPISSDGLPATSSNLLLELARFLAPLTTVTAAFAAVLLTLAKTADRLVSRRARNHTIICNPGRYGLTLAKNLRTAGESVVVIVPEAEQSLAEDLRRERIPVIEGDASDEYTLTEAGSRRARRVIGLPTKDGGNFGIAATLAKIPAEAQRREVNLFSDDSALVDFLTSHSLQMQDELFLGNALGEATTATGRDVVEWGSLDRATGTLILTEFLNLNSLRDRLQAKRDREQAAGGPDQGLPGVPEGKTNHDSGNKDPGTDPIFVKPGDLPSIIVSGRTPIADALILELAKRWWSFYYLENPPAPDGLDAASGDGRLPIILVDPEESSWAQQLVNIYPGIANSLLLQESDRTDAAVLASSETSAPVVFVLNEDPSFLLHVLAELDALPPFPVNVVVCGDPAITESLREAGVFRSRAGLEVSVFDPATRVYSADLISNTLLEQLAIIHHSIYEENVFGLPASKPWPELDADTKDSNRQAVIHHISVKLPSEGLTIAPIGNRFIEEPPFEFSRDQIERLAIIEHARWMEEKYADGWIYNPSLGDGQDKDKVPPEHGNLCPWEDLSEAARDKDRMFITGLPTILRAAGFRIVPIDTPREAEGRSA